MALSNGSMLSTRALLSRSDLDAMFAHVVSVDEVNRAKPRSEVYLHAADKAGVERAELALVAAHSWNINGAATTGLITAYLDAGHSYSSVMRTPDLEGETLPDLARQLAAL